MNANSISREGGAPDTSRAWHENEKRSDFDEMEVGLEEVPSARMDKVYRYI